MDPNATYNILRSNVDELIKLLDKLDEYDDVQDVADTVAEAFDALDGWIKKDGSLPNAWCRKD